MNQNRFELWSPEQISTLPPLTLKKNTKQTKPQTKTQTPKQQKQQLHTHTTTKIMYSHTITYKEQQTDILSTAQS